MTRPPLFFAWGLKIDYISDISKKDSFFLFGTSESFYKWAPLGDGAHYMTSGLTATRHVMALLSIVKFGKGTVQNGFVEWCIGKAMRSTDSIAMA